MSLSLREWIMHHEGVRQKPYLDIFDNWSIGAGRNLSGNGLSMDEVYYLLDNDINRCVKELEHYHWYNRSPRGVQEALTNMCFNLGITRLLKFKKMIAALECGRYHVAALEALDSLWAKQVGQRAKDVAAVIREGR